MYVCVLADEDARDGALTEYHTQYQRGELTRGQLLQELRKLKMTPCAYVPLDKSLKYISFEDGSINVH